MKTTKILLRAVFTLFLVLLAVLATTACPSDTSNSTPDNGNNSNNGNERCPNVASDSSDLYISEIRTHHFKDDDKASADNIRTNYIEIYNGTGSPVDLSNYALLYSKHTENSNDNIPWGSSDNTCTAANDGSTEDKAVDCDRIALSGTLDSGGLTVVTRKGADPAKISANFYWGNFKANGDDGAALVKKESTGTTSFTPDGGTEEKYTIIDVVGEPADPGTAWEVAGTANATREVLLRKCDAAAPTTNWDTSRGTTAADSQWEIETPTASTYDFSNVGKR